MLDLKINLIDPQPPRQPNRQKKKTIIGLGIFFILIIFVGLPAISARYFGKLSTSQIWNGLTNLNLLGDRPLSGESDDRINILLLGMGGEGHDGAFLTDTIILASLRPSDGQLAFLSIPRDLMVFIPGYGWRRVNNANSFAETAQANSGGEAAAQVISRAFDLPIQYYARLDFDGFRQAIDEVGGVRVYVDKSFTDVSFPTDDYKYQTIKFEQGWQNMDGETALKFARSRHGSNGENSDFARSRRQQKILTAFKDKIFSFETLVRPSRVRNIIDNLSQHLNTNIQLWEALRLAKLFHRSLDQPLAMRVLDDAPDGLLQATNIEGAYLLEPKNNNWLALRAVAANLLGENGKQKNKLTDAIIEIQNGTFLPGLASQSAEKLKGLGFTITAIGNAQKRDFQKTTIFDLTNGKKPEALRLIQQELKAEVSLTLPAWLENNNQPSNPLLPLPAEAKNAKIDFLIVLGTNADTL